MTTDPVPAHNEPYLAKFGVEYNHNHYGSGWFFSPDAIESLLATARADGAREAIEPMLNQQRPGTTAQYANPAWAIYGRRMAGVIDNVARTVVPLTTEEKP